MIRLASFLRPALLAILVSSTAVAQSQGNTGPSTSAPASRFRFVIEGGVEFGGEEYIELTFTDGSTQTLTTGQGGTIAFGGEFRPARLPRLALGATVGYKFVTNASENASIGITRIPVEVVGRWSLDPDWWAGAGVVMHNSVRVKGDGFFPDEDLEASLGPTLELGWRWLALTYTSQRYTNEADAEFDASAIGVSFRWVFGKK